MLRNLPSSPQNACSINRCINNGSCLNGFTEKKYLCVCQAGFTGETCEKGKNQLFVDKVKGGIKCSPSDVHGGRCDHETWLHKHQVAKPFLSKQCIFFTLILWVIKARNVDKRCKLLTCVKFYISSVKNVNFYRLLIILNFGWNPRWRLRWPPYWVTSHVPSSAATP